MRSGIATPWVKVRRRIARCLPPRSRLWLMAVRDRSRLWLKAVRDMRRHNTLILRRDPAASALCFYPQRPTNDSASAGWQLTWGFVSSARGAVKAC